MIYTQVEYCLVRTYTYMLPKNGSYWPIPALRERPLSVDSGRLAAAATRYQF